MPYLEYVHSTWINLNDILRMLFCFKPLRARTRVSRVPTMPPAPRIRRWYGQTKPSTALAWMWGAATRCLKGTRTFRAFSSCDANVKAPASPSQSNCSEAMLSSEVGRAWRKVGAGGKAIAEGTLPRHSLTAQSLPSMSFAQLTGEGEKVRLKILRPSVSIARGKCSACVANGTRTGW